MHVMLFRQVSAVALYLLLGSPAAELDGMRAAVDLKPLSARHTAQSFESRRKLATALTISA